MRRALQVPKIHSTITPLHVLSHPIKATMTVAPCPLELIAVSLPY